MTAWVITALGLICLVLLAACCGLMWCMHEERENTDLVVRTLMEVLEQRADPRELLEVLEQRADAEHLSPQPPGPGR